MKKVDGAIVGGGLAGGLLARQLRRALPDASIALFEKSMARRYKVGESTVEIATHYLIKRLGLSTYIYKEHLPKNGLRFFFDNEQKSAPITLLQLDLLGLSAPRSDPLQGDRSARRSVDRL